MILIVANISMPYYERIMMHGHEAGLREDPFTGSNQTWQVETADPAQAIEESPRSENPTVRKALTVATTSPGIVAVHSGAEGAGMDGTNYRNW